MQRSGKNFSEPGFNQHIYFESKFACKVRVQRVNV